MLYGKFDQHPDARFVVQWLVGHFAPFAVVRKCSRLFAVREMQLIYLASVRAEEMDKIKERFRTGGIPVLIAPDYSINDGMLGGFGQLRNSRFSFLDSVRIIELVYCMKTG
jgi:hypothetical protein